VIAGWTSFKERSPIRLPAWVSRRNRPRPPMPKRRRACDGLRCRDLERLMARHTSPCIWAKRTKKRPPSATSPATAINPATRKAREISGRATSFRWCRFATDGRRVLAAPFALSIAVYAGPIRRLSFVLFSISVTFTVAGPRPKRSLSVVFGARSIPSRRGHPPVVGATPEEDARSRADLLGRRERSCRTLEAA